METDAQIDAGQRQLPGALEIIERNLLWDCSQDVGRKFRALGRALHLTDGQIDGVELDHNQHGCREVAYQIMCLWQQMKGNDARWSILKNAFAKINEEQQAVPERSIPSSNSGEADEDLQNIQSYLTKKYAELELPTIIAPSKPLRLKDLYVDLIMHYGDYSSKNAKIIKLEEMFDAIEGIEATRILIEGNPGFGKTTLIHKLAQDFASRESYLRDRFDIVIPLTLRCYSGDLDKDICGYVRLHRMEDGVKMRTFRRCEKRVLLILDGYDELSSQKKKELLPLIKGEEYPMMSVIVTSRPGQFLLGFNRLFSDPHENECKYSVFQKWIKIGGISVDNQKKFLENYFDGNLNELFKKFSIVIIREMEELLKCPLFLLLITQILNFVDIKTVKCKSDLYKCAVNFQIKTNLMKMNKIDDQDDIDIFKGDESDRKSYSYYKWAGAFGKLALNLLEHDLCFVDETFHKQFLGEVETFTKLGFLRKQRPFNQNRDVIHYEIVHKTFLEFFAAVFVTHSSNPNIKRNTFCLTRADMYFPEVARLLRNGYNLWNNAMLCTFFAGLAKDKQNFFMNFLPWKFTYRVSHPVMKNLIRERVDFKLQALEHFIPSYWSIDKASAQFCKTFAHGILLQKGLDANPKRIDILHWDASVAVQWDSPVSNVDTLIVCLSESPSNFIKNSEKIICRHFICHLHVSRELDSKWDEMKNFFASIKCKTLSLHVTGKQELNATWCLNKLREELEINGIWHNVDLDFFSLSDLKLTVMSLQDIIAIVKMGKNIKSIAINSCIEKKEKVHNLLESLILEAERSATLTNLMLYVKDDLLHLNANVLGSKQWDSILLGNVRLSSSGPRVVKSFIVPLATTTQITLTNKENAVVLSEWRGLSEIKCDIEFLKELTTKAPEKWIGYDILRHMKLELRNNTFIVQQINLLKRFRHIESLSLDLLDLRTETLNRLIVCLSESLLFIHPTTLEILSVDERKKDFFISLLSTLGSHWSCEQLRIDIAFNDEDHLKKTFDALLQLLQKGQIHVLQLLCPLELHEKYLCKNVNIDEFQLERIVTQGNHFEALASPFPKVMDECKNVSYIKECIHITKKKL